MSILVDGEPSDRLALPDLGFMQGLAVFEAMRTRGGEVFRLQAHLDRLAASAAFFEIPFDRDAVGRDIETVSTSDATQAITVYLTPSQRVVRAAPLDAGRVGRPVRLATLAYEPPPSLPGWVKHTNRAAWLLASQRSGVDEVLFEDRAGHWTESSRSNVFVVRDGVAYTPPLDGRVLDGVTRREVIAAARSVGIVVVERPVRAGACDEMFVTSTLKSVAGVVELDGHSLPGLGPLGRSIRRAFAERVGEDPGDRLNSET